MKEMTRRQMVGMTAGAAVLSISGRRLLVGQQFYAEPEPRDSYDQRYQRRTETRRQVEERRGQERDTANESEDDSQQQRDVADFIDDVLSRYDFGRPESDTPLRFPEPIEELQREIRNTLPRGDDGSQSWRGDVHELQEFAPTEAACRRFNLGTHSFPNQHRLHRHGRWDFRVETRTHRKRVWVDFCHPTIDGFVNDAIHCARLAGTAAVITAVATRSPAAGLALFLPTWRICMYRRVSRRIADETRVTLGSLNEYSCWTYHC